MKQSIILWISAAIITFLTGYFQSRTSSYYPISGTFGIDGQKVSYHLKKIHNSSEDFKLIIRSDRKDLRGAVLWRNENFQTEWQIDSMQFVNESLVAVIPKQNPLTKVEYKIILNHNNKEFFIPAAQCVEVLFLGIVPFSISLHYYLTLFAGMLLSIRTGLESFNTRPRLRLYSIFTFISFFSCALIFAPVKKAYEMGIIGKSVPPISEIFEVWLLLLLLLWIAAVIVISYVNKKKIYALGFSIISIIIFFSQNL